MVQYITKTHFAVALISFCVGFYVASYINSSDKEPQTLEVAVVKDTPKTEDANVKDEINATNVIYLNKEELAKIISNLANSCVGSSISSEFILIDDINSSRYVVNSANIKDKSLHTKWHMIKSALCNEQNKTLKKYLFIRPNEVILTK